MRPKFRETLGRYRDNIIDQMQAGSNQDQLERLATSADVEIDRRARALDGIKEAQQRIFDLQHKKQNLMAELKRTLRAIDAREAHEFHKRESDRLVQFDTQRGVYLVGEGDSQEVATLSEVLFDNDFGAAYVMDFSDVTIPRSTRKRFAIEQTKRQLDDLLNRQIIEEEISRPDVADRVKQIYRTLEKKQERTETGFLAERVVEYLLKRMELDEALPFHFEVVDVYQDVAQKIDFIIKVRKKFRGVKVEASQSETIGIQFTTNESRTVFKQGQIEQMKQEGLEEVDDLVLVTIPIKHIDTVFYQWEERRRETGKTAGGPVTFLLAEEKEVLVRGLFHTVFRNDEMDRYVKNAAATFSFDQQRVETEEARVSMVWTRERKMAVGQLKEKKIYLDRLKQKRAKAEVAEEVEKGVWADAIHISKELSRRWSELMISHLTELQRWESEQVSEEDRTIYEKTFIKKRNFLNRERSRISSILGLQKQQRRQKHERVIHRLKHELEM